MTKTSYKDLLDNLLIHYIKNKNKGKELEIKFGTKWFNPITNILFENVIKKIKSQSLKTSQKPLYRLTIQTEYDDINTGKKTSNVRVEIVGIEQIQQYCKTNIIDPDKCRFTQKTSHNITINDKLTINKIDNHDFHFRVNYKK